jgi:hypothetical protein
MSASTLNRKTLMHSLQCVQAMSRMMEEFIASSAATNRDREALGEMLMDFDSVVDNLSTVYEEMRAGDERYPSAEDLDGAFESFAITRKA